MPPNQLLAATLDSAAAGRNSAVPGGVVKEMAAITLDERGMICDCNPASETLFEYCRSELVRRHVSMLLPELTEVDLMLNGEPNPRLRFLCHTGRRYQAVTRNGGCFASKLFFNCLDNAGREGISLIVRPVEGSAGGQR